MEGGESLRSYWRSFRENRGERESLKEEREN
jgi:hypothetical protein